MSVGGTCDALRFEGPDVLRELRLAECVENECVYVCVSD